jgi:hypothetical protein
VKSRCFARVGNEVELFDDEDQVVSSVLEYVFAQQISVTSRTDDPRRSQPVPGTNRLGWAATVGTGTGALSGRYRFLAARPLNL